MMVGSKAVSPCGHQRLRSASILEKGFDMLLAVLVGCVKVVQLLLQVGNLRFHFHCLLGLTSLDVFSRSQNKPVDIVSRGDSSLL